MLIIDPHFFFSLGFCPNQPRIDFSYYKYVPTRHICLLICALPSATTFINVKSIQDFLGRKILMKEKLQRKFKSFKTRKAYLKSRKTFYFFKHTSSPLLFPFLKYFISIFHFNLSLQLSLYSINDDIILLNTPKNICYILQALLLLHSSLTTRFSK